jgi:hypothetical protein
MRALFLAAILLGSPAFPSLHAADVPVHCGIEMRNVLLHASDGVVLQVRALDGEFVSRGAGQPPVFDDPRSYTVKLRAADISMDVASLNALLRQSLATQPASPIKDVTISLEDGALKATGKLHKGVWVPFSMTASVSGSPDGSIRLHATKLKAVGVPVKGLLDLLGLDVASLMKMPPGSGLRADGDDLLMDPTALLPPPRMEGKVKAVSISGNRLVMQLAGAGAPPKRPRHAALAGLAQLSVFLRRQHPLREADDVGCRHAIDRQRPLDAVRFLSRALRRPARCRLFEEHAAQGAAGVHARLRSPQEGTLTTGAPSTCIFGVTPSPGCFDAAIRPLIRCGAPSAVDTVT